MKLINTYTGSYPIVFHAPGSSRTHDFWKALEQRIDGLQPVAMQESIEIITWSTYDEPTVLERCCDKLNIPITVLRPSGEWHNLRKVHSLLEYLPNCKADYVLGLDSADVILIDSPDEILKRFKEAFPVAKLVYNGGFKEWPRRFCHPVKECTAFEKQFKGRNRHLNAGAFFGETAYVLEHYKDVAAVERDKIFHTKYRNMEQPSVRVASLPHKYPSIDVDRNSAIFQHMLTGVTDLAYTADYTNLDGKRLVYYDLGAFIGQTLWNFVIAHSPDVAYGFEPSAANQQSDYWLKIKKHKNVKLVDAAVWTEDTTIDFYLDEEKHQSQSCTAISDKSGPLDKEHPVTVEAVDFCKFFNKRYKANDYTVIKMDIEGAEYSVLKQMIESDALSKVDELRIEFHGAKMDGDYSAQEDAIRDYCKEHNVNLIEMDH
jgi:FkbM family methyltransferase